jgi:hypothetical protein
MSPRDETGTYVQGAILLLNNIQTIRKITNRKWKPRAWLELVISMYWKIDFSCSIAFTIELCTRNVLKKNRSMFS